MESSINKIDLLLNKMCDEDSPFNLDNKFLEELGKLDIIEINTDKKDKEKEKENFKSKDKELIDSENNDDNLIITKNVDE